MLNKLLSFTFTILIIFCCVEPQKVSADYCDDVERNINEILDFNIEKSGSVQNWIDSELSDSIGDGSEWYIFGLCQSDEKYDFTMFEKALDNYLKENTISSASSRIKFALIYLAIGSENDYSAQIIDDTIGQQGIISYIFGLHMLSNGIKSEKFNVENVKNKIISMQLSDGGWAVMGEDGDVDVTAMAVQALSPLYNLDNKTKSSVDKAIAFLSDKQNENGNYSSFGVENVESASETIIGLAGLNIDLASDERFTKNGKNLLDSINAFQLDVGGYSHEINGKYSKLATAKVFCSLVAYRRFLNENSAFFDFSENSECENDASKVSETAKNDNQKVLQNKSTMNQDSHQNTDSDIYIKLFICAVFLVSILIVIGIMKIKKRLNKKNALFCILAGLLCVAIIWLNDFQSAKKYYGTQRELDKSIGSVSISISCENLAGKKTNAYIPSDFNILDKKNIQIESGDTVCDVLKEACRENEIQLEMNGNSDRLAYITGINYLYEFDYGELSGWIYTVNGEKSSVGCGEFEVSDGDVIEWRYSCDLGNDLR